jgi:hypothetical protein
MEERRVGVVIACVGLPSDTIQLSDQCAEMPKRLVDELEAALAPRHRWRWRINMFNSNRQVEHNQISSPQGRMMISFTWYVVQKDQRLRLSECRDKSCCNKRKSSQGMKWILCQ